MLPIRSRLKNKQLLTTTVRRGSRAGRKFVVVHYLPPTGTVDSAPQVAFAVNKAVGGSVVRHRVVRRLRHVIRGKLNQLPPGSSVVVRALPAAAEASSADLASDIDALLPRVVKA